MSAQLTLHYPQTETPYAFPGGTILVLALFAVIGLIVADTRLAARATFEPPAVPVMATFTGSYENGVPVYRLPAVEITAARPKHRIAANTAGQTPAGQSSQ